MTVVKRLARTWVLTPALVVLVAALACAPAPREAPAADAAAATGSAPEPLATFRSSRDLVAVPKPVRIEIPRIGVRSGLEWLRKQKDRTVEVPARWNRAGWYADGPVPGQRGAAVVLGHVDSPDGPAVFANLSALRPGDKILIRRSDGSRVRFVVERLEQHDRRRFPTIDVYWPTLEPELRLITCGGAYRSAAGGYQSNVVVFAVALSRDHPPAGSP